MPTDKLFLRVLIHEYELMEKMKRKEEKLKHAQDPSHINDELRRNASASGH